MDTPFNFKSSVCTDKNQSERLLALGLKKETADMCYKVTTHDWRGHEIPERDKHYSLCNWYDELNIVSGFEQIKTIPAWSLHRLIEMMPMGLIEDRVYHERWDLNVTPIAVIYRSQYEPNEWIGECLGQGMYNNIIDCIEWLIKEGYFNKEYLEE